MEDAIDAISYVTRSPTRVRLLSMLGPEPRGLSELAGAVDASDRTVRRAIGGLVEEGWVCETAGGYVLTAVGERFREELLGFVETTRTLSDLASFFEWFPEDACDLDLTVFEDATVTIGTAHEPYAPIERTQALIEDAETILTIAPIAAPFYNDPYYDQIVSENARVETILRPEVLRTLQEKQTASMREVRRHDNVAIYVYEEEFPFGLLVVDDRVAIGAYDETWSLRAVLESDAEEVLSWGRSTFETYRAEARRIDADDR